MRLGRATRGSRADDCHCTACFALAAFCSATYPAGLRRRWTFYWRRGPLQFAHLCRVATVMPFLLGAGAFCCAFAPERLLALFFLCAYGAYPSPLPEHALLLLISSLHPACIGSCCSLPATPRTITVFCAHCLAFSLRSTPTCCSMTTPDALLTQFDRLAVLLLGVGPDGASNVPSPVHLPASGSEALSSIQQRRLCSWRYPAVVGGKRCIKHACIPLFATPASAHPRFLRSCGHCLDGLFFFTRRFGHVFPSPAGTFVVFLLPFALLAFTWFCGGRVSAAGGCIFWCTPFASIPC